MAPSPGTPPRRPSQNEGTPTRTKSILAAAFLGRPLNRRAPDDVEEGGKAGLKAVDLGKPLGPYDTNSVRDRVRKWQAQGGGVIMQPDPLIYPPEATPVVSEVGARTARGSDEESTDIEELRRRNRHAARRKSKLAAEEEQEEQEAKKEILTPKKRVISDSHWRKKRSPPTHSPNAFPDDGIRVTPIREVTDRRKRQEEVTTTSDTFLGDDGIRVYPTARRGMDTKKASKSSVDDDGIRVYSSRRRGKDSGTTPPNDDGKRVHNSAARRDSAHVRPERSAEHLVRSSRLKSIDDNGSPSMTPTPIGSKAQRKPSAAVEEAAEISPEEDNTLRAERGPKHRRSNRGKERTPEHPPKSRESSRAKEKPMSKVQPSKVKVVKDTHDAENISLKPTRVLEPVPQVSGNRIEAWLSETPDPFVDAPPDATVPNLQAPEITDQSLPITCLNEVNDQHFSPSDTKCRSYEKTSELDDIARFPKNSSLHSASKESLPIAEGDPQVASQRLKRVGARRGSPVPVREPRMPSPAKKLFVEDDTVSSVTNESLVDVPKPAIDLQLNEFTQLPSTLKKRLSTIASVETLGSMVSTPRPRSAAAQSDVTVTKAGLTGKAATEEYIESETGDTFDSGMPQIPSKKPGLKRRLTTHADLISVLSLPKGGSKSIISARSIRTNRSRLATATIGDLLRELATDEAKYMRELRTLVDGVIPVLLTCALSKSDSAVVAELFSRSVALHKTDPGFTRPIIDMGIALERLKSLHRRVPLHSADEFLIWAKGAQRVYSEYLKAWRLGFQDVVVNLAPGKDAGSINDSQSLYNGLPRNEDGDVVNGDGERVDVAFLLKRPLVRLKYLAKTLKGINYISPSSEAEEQATRYQNLVTDARRRSNEERARLEDEAAANVDATRVRDLRTLGPLTGVSVDCTRRVRARDVFNLNLHHSSGQRMDCKVELVLRDDAPGRGTSGDILICEVDGTGQWLLFPPVSFGRASARNGNLKGEIVVMIRGLHSRGKEWQELLVLQNDDEQVGFDWVQMLGLSPVPPTIIRQPSFRIKDDKQKLALYQSTPTSDRPSSAGRSRTPSPRQIQIPIGEQARLTFKVESQYEMESPIREHGATPADYDRDSTTSLDGFRYGIPQYDQRSCLGRDDDRLSLNSQKNEWGTPKRQESPSPSHREAPVTPISLDRSGSLKDDSISPPSRRTSTQREHASEARRRAPRDLNEAMMMAGGVVPSPLKRSKAKREARSTDSSPTQPRSSRSSRYMDDSPRIPAAHRPKRTVTRSPSPDSRVPTATSKVHVSRGEEIVVSFLSKHGNATIIRDAAPPTEEQISLTNEETRISRTKTATNTEGSNSESEYEVYADGMSSAQRRSPPGVPALDLPTIPKTRNTSRPSTPVRGSGHPLAHEDRPRSPLSVSDLGSSVISMSETEEPFKETALADTDLPPPTPPHGPSPVQLKGLKTPVLSPPGPPQRNGVQRRSSSPLKHEYEPSSASSSSSSDSESAPENDTTSFSDSSEEEELEDGDAPTPLLPMAALRAIGKVSPHGSIYSLPNGTLSPSQAASQQVTQLPAKAFKSVATVFSWSDKGAWEPLHPDECSIVISPGLIEAYHMSELHSRPTTAEPIGSPRKPGDAPDNLQPIVALELTPLVPLRRGTALDISIRSPPIGQSKIKVGNNIMFRSRNPEECETLYGALNTSRINNPKYIALQNAIPQHDPMSSFMDRRSSSRGASGIWGWGSRSSYRANGAAAPSITSSESSIGSLSSAFSALRRFGNGGKLFNISKSTISSRTGSRTGSIISSSSGGSSGFGGMNGISTPPEEQDPNKGSPIGLSNAKIRLYCRETASKWRDMGSARLAIMHPPSGHKSSNNKHNQEEKRILVTSKASNAPLLDVCLSESCFERVARTGIALSVWEERIGLNGEVEHVAAVGGVGGKSRVYMIQMKTEAETAYTFSLVGKLRY